MRLDPKFVTKNTKFNSFFVSKSSTFNASFSHSGGEKYDGSYEIFPKIQEQTMPTKNKLLTEDMVIKSIPVIKVSNASGGNTVIIGG